MKHWTEKSVDDYLHRIVMDYIQQLDAAMDSQKVTQSALASRLGVTDGRVSQVLNNPGNMTLKKIIQYARALKRKVAIVSYDDGDPENERGPINAQIFEVCWMRSGQPSDFFELHWQWDRVEPTDSTDDSHVTEEFLSNKMTSDWQATEDNHG